MTSPTVILRTPSGYWQKVAAWLEKPILYSNGTEYESRFNPAYFKNSGDCYTSSIVIFYVM